MYPGMLYGSELNMELFVTSMAVSLAVGFRAESRGPWAKSISMSSSSSSRRNKNKRKEDRQNVTNVTSGKTSRYFDHRIMMHRRIVDETG